MDDTQPGLTFRSVAAGILTMLLAAMFIQYTEVVVDFNMLAHYSVAPPALWAFLLVTLFCLAVFAATRWRLLTRAELVCVLFATLIAAPLVTQGFWQRVVAAAAALPRSGDFEKLDALNDNFWPHGPNLLAGAFQPPAAAGLVFRGGHRWESIEWERGATANLPVLVNTEADEVAAVRVQVPLEKHGRPFLLRNEPYLIAVLARARELAPGTRYSCRLYEDNQPGYVEVFNTDAPEKVTALRQRGFQRVGLYGFTIRPEVRDHVWLEFDLRGPGRLELWDPKLLSVGTLERVYQGRLMVSEDEYARLPAGARNGLIVRPRTLWSWAGLKFIAAGYIPVVEWGRPLLAWGGYALLLLLGCLALAVIMRRQWFDRERYQMPVAQAVGALADDPGGAEHALPAIWRNRMMWLGLGLTFAWTLLRAWSFYNPKVPDLSVKVFLDPYFSDPQWGGMFTETRFEVNGIFLAICGFAELNLLASLVAGYWLFRSLRWLGVGTGWNAMPNYPFPSHQQVASYVAYGVMVLVLTRRHWARVLRAAWTGDRAESAGEALSYRSAVLLLLAVFAGCIAWSAWLDLRLSGMLLFFAAALLVAFVAMKIRAECGLAWGYFAPSFTLLVALLGGLAVVGAPGALVVALFAYALCITLFLMVPGAQLELLELGRRWQVRPRHLAATCVFGIVGGLVLGGWVFLSNAYALGGQTLRHGWSFNPIISPLYDFNTWVAEATATLTTSVAPDPGFVFSPQFWAGIGAAVATTVTALLRQFVAGFWFHPVGVILGCTYYAHYVWGSALAALVIRRITLWVGGAVTVRNKLQPFFVGVLLGDVLAQLLIAGHGAYLRGHGVERIFTVFAW